jgi:hypothetical protein
LSPLDSNPLTGLKMSKSKSFSTPTGVIIRGVWWLDVYLSLIYLIKTSLLTVKDLFTYSVFAASSKTQPYSIAYILCKCLKRKAPIILRISRYSNYCNCILVCDV